MTILALSLFSGSLIEAFAHPHAPNLGLIAHVSPVIRIHLFAALVAFVIGTVQILGPKGTLMHRILGYSWLAFMLVVAISSFFIRVINHGQFSLIHILSGLTLFSVPVIIYAARAKKIDMHRRNATRLYVGALVIAGLFTFVPGRLMWAIFFG